MAKVIEVYRISPDTYDIYEGTKDITPQYKDRFYTPAGVLHALANLSDEPVHIRFMDKTKQPPSFTPYGDWPQM